MSTPQGLSSGQIHHWDSVHHHRFSLADSKTSLGRPDKLDITSPWLAKRSHSDAATQERLIECWMTDASHWSGVIQDTLVLKEVWLSQRRVSTLGLIHFRGEGRIWLQQNCINIYQPPRSRCLILVFFSEHDSNKLKIAANRSGMRVRHNKILTNN